MAQDSGELFVVASAMLSSATLIGIGGLTAGAMAATLYAWGTIDKETLYLALMFIAMACGVLMSG